METSAMTSNPMTLKLTKKILMAGPVGSYLVSNCYSDMGATSIFEEEVAPKETREEQWKRALDAGAGYRTCRFFNTKHDYQCWLDHVISNQR